MMPKKGGKDCPVLFSPEDADLAAVVWTLNARGYAHRTIVRNGRRVCQYAHRAVGERIAGRPLTRADEVDHLHHNKLDCRRSELAIVTTQQNGQNVKARSPTGIRGVVRRGDRFEARVRTQGKVYILGRFDTPEEAGKAAAKKRRELGFHNEPPGVG